MNETKTEFYVESASYLSFRELCDACSDQAKIGMSFGRPGVGKTEAALRYSGWSLMESNLAVRNGVPLRPEDLLTRTALYYKPGITISPQRLKSELTVHRNRFFDMKERAFSWTLPGEWIAQKESHRVRLIIVDEAHRLKYQCLEELRDLQERWNVGIILIGDPGMESSLPRMFHFADRVRYAEKFEALTTSEVSQYVDYQAEALQISKPRAEVYAMINSYSRGNPRTLGHLFALIERILKINSDIVDGITPEVVDTARELMLVRLGGGNLKSFDQSKELASAV